MENKRRRTLTVVANEENMDLTDEDFTTIARAIFEEDERTLPEGRTWESLDNSDVAAYRNMAKAAYRAWGALGRPGNVG